jgi:zinc D-Ala-D-Ala carboxypeptidase
MVLDSQIGKALALVSVALVSVWMFRSKRPSKNFSLEELTVTNTGFANQPGAAELANLSRLANSVLEPIRAEFGPIRVTSAFRSKNTNQAVKGAKSSDHLTGLGADIYATNGASAIDLATWLFSNPNIPVRQVIVYPETTGHLHVAMDIGEPPFAREFLKKHSRIQTNGKYYTEWKPTNWRRLV